MRPPVKNQREPPEVIIIIHQKTLKLKDVDTSGSSPQGEATHDGMLRSEGGAPGGLTPAVCMALRRFRPPTGEANHDGMLR